MKNKIRILLCSIFLLLIIPCQSQSQDLNIKYSKDKLIELITNEMGYELSTRLYDNKKAEKLTGFTNYYKYPLDQPIPIRIANFNNNKTTFYCVVEFPKDFKIDEDTHIYKIVNNFGQISCATILYYKSIPSDIQNKLKKDFITKEIVILLDKVHKAMPPTKEVIEANKLWIKRILISVKMYFNGNPKLKQKYGSEINVKLEKDDAWGSEYPDILVGSHFVNTYITSDKEKTELKLWVYCIDEGKLLNPFVVEKSGWEIRHSIKDSIKTIYTIKLNK